MEKKKKTVTGKRNNQVSGPCLRGYWHTSPIYTVTVVFLPLKPTHGNILGVLSLIVWTLIALVTVQYSLLAMSLSRRGEGGTIVLKEILTSLLTSRRSITTVTIIFIVGVSASNRRRNNYSRDKDILSAVEGAVFIPGFENLSTANIVLISAPDSISAFCISKKRHGKVANALRPHYMHMVYISCLSRNSRHIKSPRRAAKPSILTYAFKFLAENKIAGFISLGEIILCATGSEAMYADMETISEDP